MTDLQRRRRSALVGGAAAAALFALLAVLVAAKADWLTDLDRGLGEGPERFTDRRPWLLDAANDVARWTHPDNVVVVVLLTAVVLAFRGHRRAAIWSLLVIAVARVGYISLKVLIERPRPEYRNPDAHAGGFSFPSGHSTVIFAAAGVFVVLAIVFSGTRVLRHRLIALAVLVAVAVGVDRILLGVHYASDVLGGLLLATAITLLALAVYDPLPRRTTIAP